MSKKIAVILGSKSDFEKLKDGFNLLKEFEIAYSMDVISAHRNPEKMAETLKTSLAQGVAELSRLPLDELVSRRYERLTRYDGGR